MARTSSARSESVATVVSSGISASTTSRPVWPASGSIPVPPGARGSEAACGEAGETDEALSRLAIGRDTSLAAPAAALRSTGSQRELHQRLFELLGSRIAGIADTPERSLATAGHQCGPSCGPWCYWSSTSPGTPARGDPRRPIRRLRPVARRVPGPERALGRILRSPRSPRRHPHVVESRAEFAERPLADLGRARQPGA